MPTPPARGGDANYARFLSPDEELRFPLTLVKGAVHALPAMSDWPANKAYYLDKDVAGLIQDLNIRPHLRGADFFLLAAAENEGRRCSVKADAFDLDGDVHLF